MAEPAVPGLGRVVAGFGFARRKTWPFIGTLLVMMAIGLARIASHGLREEWGIVLLLVVLPGMALVMLLTELRLETPVLVIGERGLLDKRRGPNPIGWSAIQEATFKRSVLSKSIRIVLTNGERYDIDVNLLAADPGLVMRHIQEQAGKS